MKAVKCVGCGRLVREAQPPDAINPKFPLVIYNCADGRFPYWCALSGLLKPSRGIEKAAAGCPVDISQGCIVCGTGENLTSYGESKFAYACYEHHWAWSKWLDDHPGKRAYFKSGSRIIHSHWIEGFREWVAEAKKD